MMKINKYRAGQIAFGTFRFSVYFLATAIAFNMIFSGPAAIKQAFMDTHAYDRFVSLTITAVSKTQTPGTGLPLEDPEIQEIIKESFPPLVLQLHTEKVIDSTYEWLEGETTQPDFVVDFSASIDSFAHKASTYAVQRMARLPLCDVEPLTINPFRTTCQPKSFNFTRDQLVLETDIRTNNGLLPKTVYTARDLPKTTTGKTIIEEYSYVPAVFRFTHYLPYVLLVTAAIGALSAIWLDRKRHQAARRIGVSIIWVNIIIILSPIFYLYVLPFMFPALGVDTSGGGGSIVLSDVASKLSREFSNQLILTGLFLIVIGAMAMLFERATRPKSRYASVSSKAGLVSSEKQPRRKKRMATDESPIPLQTSEGKPRKKNTSKSAKRYRKMVSKEFR